MAQAGGESDDDMEQILCLGCQTASDESNFLLCEGEDEHDGSPCVFGCHFYCLDPPLKSVPLSTWYCPICRGVKYISNPCIYCSSCMYDSNIEKEAVYCYVQSCQSTCHVLCLQTSIQSKQLQQNDDINDSKSNNGNNVDNNDTNANCDIDNIIQKWVCPNCKNERYDKLLTSRQRMFVYVHMLVVFYILQFLTCV